MHISLVIDLLTAVYLIHGLLHSSRRLRKFLCLASLIYLAFISIHTYIIFARYFGFFERHPSLETRGLDVFLNFFGGFWTLFGVMVLAKGVAWIALAFAIYAIVGWFNKSENPGSGLTLSPPQSPPPSD